MEKSDEPDFGTGVPIALVPNGGMLRGKVGGDDAILARRGDEFFAVGATCTHYSGPLAEGLLLGDELRCPWHHACFDIRTGEALRPPAFDDIPCWRVERVGDRVFVRQKRRPSARRRASGQSPPSSIVIVGGGAAGLTAADTLRREGYEGALTILSADRDPPCDRPNLSKDYLAGTASDEWIPLRPAEYYADQRIDLVLGSRVTALDTQQRRVQVEGGKAHAFDRLLLATGADPVKLPIPGASDSQVHYLRTYADSRAVVARAASAKQVVVVGASFIGLEVAASLRTRGIGVHVVAREGQPLERVLGAEVGRFIRGLHEANGVVFHFQESVARVDGRKAILESGASLEADLLILGVGVRPSLALAEQAGLRVDRGVVVDEYLETSAPGIFAAGDLATWPDARSGALLRVEHWVVAERQGKVAARNMLGRRERFAAVPFFWTQQYDVSIKYVGHADKWDAVEIDGSLQARDCSIAYKLAGSTLAVATLSRDLHSLKVEASLET